MSLLKYKNSNQFNGYNLPIFLQHMQIGINSNKKQKQLITSSNFLKNKRPHLIF